MCTSHKTLELNTKQHNHDHKHNPSSSCCAAPKITSIKAESAVSDCCSSVDKSSDSDSCCGSDSGDSDPSADINQDGRVSLTDFSILLFNWTG